MFTTTIELPQPFRRALAEGRPALVVDEPAPTSAAYFARALARLALGREAEARQDFELAAKDFPAQCRLELAHLELRQRAALKHARDEAQEVLDVAPAVSRLAGRALHILGLAEGKLRNTSAAADALLRAADVYLSTGDYLARAQVFDTLGSIEAARGRLDYATHCYAMSLVDKALLGDRPGMAITLGNLGRLHLRAGRLRDAVDCFRRDLALAEELGDLRGIARMHSDLGRTWLELADLPAAEAALATAVELAGRHGYGDLAFFAHRDRARLLIAQRRFDDAADALDAAQAAMPKDGEPYLACLLVAARGELALARRDANAVDLLTEAVRGFEQAELPDLEIPARIALAHALVHERDRPRAEECLLRGLEIARADGFQRFRRNLDEAMTQVIGGLGPAVVESDREISTQPAPERGDYIQLEKLGEGTFGEVWRVWDSRRGAQVALKRLFLDTLYDVGRRESILASARRELLAASRVQHPGVVRVLSVGSTRDGTAYVVQELVAGRSLRRVIEDASRPDPRDVFLCLHNVAWSLAALHEAGVIHRDLKPENVIIRPDGLPVLVDFGIAYLPDVDRDPAGRIAGTLAYMAPEQASGKKTDARSDLYALGVIAYEWLCGERPLVPRGNSLDAIAHELATRQPLRLAQRRGDLAADVERLVMSLLAKKPRQRPASAADVARDMRALAESSRVDPTASTQPLVRPAETGGGA